MNEIKAGDLVTSGGLTDRVGVVIRLVRLRRTDGADVLWHGQQHTIFYSLRVLTVVPDAER